MPRRLIADIPRGEAARRRARAASAVSDATRRVRSVLTADIPHSVAAARAAAKAIGAPLSAARYRSMAEAERLALSRARQRLSHQRRRLSRVPLTVREAAERPTQRAALAEQLVYQRTRTLRDSIDAGASPSTVVRLAREWALNPDYWWSYARDVWADDDDYEDVTSHDVYGEYHDSPPV